MGKTSTDSYLNLPGRLGWFLMEIVGPVNLLSQVMLLPPSDGSVSFPRLPRWNGAVVALYVLHYINRAIVNPLFVAPSMSPVHVFMALSGALFNYVNSQCLAGWALGFPLSTALPDTPSSKKSSVVPCLGLVLFFLGMAGNIRAERTLYSLRRDAANAGMDKKETKDKETGHATTNRCDKAYVIPPARGLFSRVLFPHYACEWLEWLGYSLIGTGVACQCLPSPHASTSLSAQPGFPFATCYALVNRACVSLGLSFPLPAVVFLVNVVATTAARASWGRKWYISRFGDEKVAGRKAVIPGLI